MESCYEQEIACLQNALEVVSLHEVAKAGLSFEELRWTSIAEEEEEAHCGDEEADKEREEGMLDQILTEEEEEVGR